MRSRLVAAAVIGVLLGLVGPAPARADVVPPAWGMPAYEDGAVAVTARVDGRVHGRPGNQHVMTLRSSDEEVAIGQIVDWWCPAGMVAPENPDDQSRCRERARTWVDFDAQPGWSVKKWAKDLSWLELRAPVVETDATGAVLQRGTVSLRVRGTGATTVTVYEEFHEVYLFRDGGKVVGGELLGIPWRAMTDVRVDDLWLYRYFDVPASS